MNKRIKQVGAAALAAVMSASLVQMPVFASGEDNNPTEKTETVYAVLNDDGSVDSEVVSDQLHDEDGITNISENLNLTDVENVKTDEEPTVKGNNYTWNVDGNDVYYQGNSTKALPVNVSIKYTLDGKEISSDQLEGKSGHLKMSVTFTNTQTTTETIDGRTVDIHPSYLAGGLLTLDSDSWSNVKCSQGEVSSDGSSDLVMFATIPGLKDTLSQLDLDKVSDELDLSDTIEIEADVKEYEPATIMMGMTSNFDLSTISDISSISELTSGISSLVSASDQLLSGSQQLYEGTTTLKTEAEPLTSAYPQIYTLAENTTTLNNGAKSLQTGVANYTAGVLLLQSKEQGLYGIVSNINAIDQGITHATYTDESGVEQKSLLTGAQELSAGLSQLRESTGKISTDQLEQLSTLISTSTTQLAQMKLMIQKDQAILVGDGTEENTGLKGELEASQAALSELSQVPAALEKIQAGYTNLIAAANAQISTYSTAIGNANTDITDAVGKTNTNINTAVTDTNNAIDSAITALKNSKLSTDGLTGDDLANAEAYNSDIDTKVKALQDSKVSAYTLTAGDYTISTTDVITAQKTLEGIQVKLDGTIDNLSTIVDTLSDSVSDMSDTIDDANDKLSELSDDVDTASSALSQLGTALSNAKLGDQDLVTSIKTLQQYAIQLDQGGKSIVEGVKTVDGYLQQLSAGTQSGIDTLVSGTSQITAYNDELNNGMTTLQAGTQTLEDNKATFNSMADGLKSLGEAFTTLNDGAKELYEGNQEFTDEGMSQLQSKVDLTVDEVELLKDTLNAVIELSNSQDAFSGAPNGATVTTRYILRTKDED